ncbi:MAG: inorganic diphosphatase [Bacteriovoracaceae bacterium]|nr:inorganic diphosphatase [Bacteriovoracaceae bacterium]
MTAIVNPRDYIDETISVVVDRPLGSKHPRYPKMVYPINYGYVPNTLSGDGKELDVYVLGIDKPLTTFTGKCIGYIERLDDNDAKLLVVGDDRFYSQEEIKDIVHFQEQYFDSRIIRWKADLSKEQVEMLEIEAGNMIPILKNNKMTYDYVKSAESVLKSENTIVVKSNEFVTGFLRYSVKDNVAKVYSIQLKDPESGNACLLPLLRKTITNMNQKGVRKIESVVQKSNKRSLNFHEKLGFDKVGEDKESFFFKLTS